MFLGASGCFFEATLGPLPIETTGSVLWKIEGRLSLGFVTFLSKASNSSEQVYSFLNAFGLLIYPCPPSHLSRLSTLSTLFPVDSIIPSHFCAIPYLVNANSIQPMTATLKKKLKLA